MRGISKVNYLVSCIHVVMYELMCARGLHGSPVAPVLSDLGDQGISTYDREIRQYLDGEGSHYLFHLLSYEHV